MRFYPVILACLLPIGLVACSDNKTSATLPPVPMVKTVILGGEAKPLYQGFSGTVRARSEIPLAFEVPGRISRRHVDAGQTVEQGQALFTLDSRDLEQNQASAQAALNATEAEWEVARADLARHKQLIGQHTISQQVFDRVQLNERAAASRVQVAQAQLQQSRIALEHTVLRAKSAGVLMDVRGEPGEVVKVGEPRATLADASQLEVELHLPDGFTPPQQGEMLLGTGHRVVLQLREIAGAADTVSRTWRVRYQVIDAPKSLKLGSVVRVSLAQQVGGSGVFDIPIGALDERGATPQVWQVENGKAQAVPVQVMALQHETALIATDLPAGVHVVALGAHLMAPGMTVQEQKP